ncbi:MAG TPA: MFS transporter [Alphaproteobacteria bacterium]
MESATRSSSTNWSVVLLLVGAGVVVAFQIGKAPAALPILRDELHLSLVTAGWVISMFNVIGLITGMAIGVLADRIGHRRMVLAGLTVVALASLAGAAAQGAAALLISRFLEGLGFVVVVIAAPGLIVRAAAPQDLKLAFGAWGAYMPAGTATMMALSPLLLAPFGWRGLWVANAVLVALFAVLLSRTTRAYAAARRTGSSASMLGDMWRTLTSPGPPVLALAFASYALQYLVVFGFLPTILVEEEGLSQAAAAALTAIAIAANVPGNLMGGMILHRGAPRWAMVVVGSAIMGLLAFGIYAPAFPLWLRYGLAVVFSLLCGMIPSTLLGAAPVHAPSPHLVATTNGLIMQGSNLGQAVGPPAAAALAAAVGNWHWSPVVLVTAALIGIALGFVLRALERRAGGR